jgi:hypothetical protein
VVVAAARTSANGFEYERSRMNERYTLLAQGQPCVDCHVMARRTDWVFTQR